MPILSLFTLTIAALLAAGEFARWWGNPRFIPLALDELFVAFAMAAAALLTKRFGYAPLAAAWGSFCGLIGTLLVETVDHLMFGPPKESAVFYAITLGVMLALGLAALWRSLAAARPANPAR